jgi:hypothetical protein
VSSSSDKVSAVDEHYQVWGGEHPLEVAILTPIYTVKYRSGVEETFMSKVRNEGASGVEKRVFPHGEYQLQRFSLVIPALPRSIEDLFVMTYGYRFSIWKAPEDCFSQRIVCCPLFDIDVRKVG